MTSEKKTRSVGATTPDMNVAATTPENAIVKKHEQSKTQQAQDTYMHMHGNEQRLEHIKTKTWTDQDAKEHEAQDTYLATK